MKTMRIIIDEIHVPVVVDAGIGKPSQACEAMEMGADACLVNTAIASAPTAAGCLAAISRPSASRSMP
jgi:thiazole synthase